MSEPQSGQEMRRRQRTKNWVMLVVLVAFVVVVYFTAVVRMGSG